MDESADQDDLNEDFNPGALVLMWKENRFREQT